MIDIKNFNGFILVQKIKEHYDFKDKLMLLIDKMPEHSFENKSDKIFKTDYYNSNVNKVYKETFLKLVEPYNNNLKLFFKCSNFNIKEIWYQQYKTLDVHNWHIHFGCLLTNVYFLDLKNKNSTLFYDYLSNKKIKYDLQEGDLITFPSYIPHKSEENLEYKKTIISYNADFDIINIA
jgi:hypothetical protein